MLSRRKWTRLSVWFFKLSRIMVLIYPFLRRVKIMSNMDRLLGKGRKAPAAKPRPVVPAATPLIDEDSTPTRDTQVRREEAPASGEDHTTNVMDLRSRAKPSGTDGASAKPALAPVRPVSTVDELPPIAPVPEEKPKAPQVNPVDELFGKLKEYLDTALAPIRERLESLEGKVAEHGETLAANDQSIEAIITSIEGPDEDAPQEEKVDEEGEPVVGLADQVAELREALGKATGAAELSKALLGEKADEFLADFEGQPVLPLLREQVLEDCARLDELVGERGERTQVMLKDHMAISKDLLVAILRENYSEDPKESARILLGNIGRTALERVPADVRDVLESFTRNPSSVEEVLARFEGYSITQLNDPEKRKEPEVASAAKKVEVLTDGVVKRAAFCLKKLDWAAIEERVAKQRAAETGGDE
jgi:hypothetical protein